MLTPAPTRGAERTTLHRRGTVILLSLLAATTVAVVLGRLTSRKDDPEALWTQAEIALRSEHREDARRLLGRIERLRPSTVHDLLLKAQLAAADGHIDESIAVLARVPTHDALVAQAELLAGRLERVRHRARHAETHFRRALQHQPEMIEAHKELIYIYGVQLRRREVDGEFAALARSTRLTHHDLFTWSLTHYTTWNPDVARDLRAFVDADPDDRYSRLALAETLLDQPGHAAQVARLLDALPRDDAKAVELRVALALHLGRIGEARERLDGSPEDAPGLARYRGRLAMLQKDAASAVGHYRIALSAEPYDRVSAFDLGQALMLMGDRAEAETHLQRAKRLNEHYNLVMRVRAPGKENRPPDLIKLAAACEAAGLTEEARQWYVLAVDGDPLDTNAQQALFRLRALTANR